MKITLFDKNPLMCNEWIREFGNYKDISITESNLLEMPQHNYLVTAGNSFGAMSEGIELGVRELFGYNFQDCLQLGIMESFPYGIPVGELMIVECGENNHFTTVMYAPITRTPSKARPLDIMYVMSVIVNFAFDLPEKSFAISNLGSDLSLADTAKSMRAGYDACLAVRGNMGVLI